MGLSTGARLGPYEIVGLLGAGGMGEVYRARDPRLGRTVALKVLPRAFAEDQERLRRFEQEAKTASALNHPGIVVVHDVGNQDGVAFLVLELLEGDTLRGVLARGPLPVRKALDYAAQVARGLAAAHARDIVHRDLKPENLFVTSDGRVKILDFGLAKSAPPPLEPSQATGSLAADAVHTEPGVVLGTLGYMSPEQLRGQPADARSDLFALGAVLYEMLAGRRAFVGDSGADVMSAILGQDPPALTSTGRSVTAGLERVVARCLEKRAEERFHSARDLAFALDSLSDTSGGSAVAAGAPTASRLRRLGFAAALAGLVAVALFAVGLRRPKAAASEPIRLQVTLPDGVAPARFPVAGSMAFSPDGRRLAIVAVTKGRPMLWVRTLDRLEATLLEGTEGAASPFWSPDSRALAFFVGGKLKKIPLAGGPAEELCTAEFGNAGTWGPDGTILFAEWAGGRDGLYRVSAQGGTAAPVQLRTAAGPEKGIAWPAFLPDGRHFVYLSGAFGRSATRTIALAALGSPEARYVVPADSKPLPVAGGRLLFLRDGALLVQAFDAAAARLSGEPTLLADLVWYGRASGTADFTVSDDGRALAWRGPSSAGRIVWLDRGGRELTQLGPPGIADGLRLSPDGGRVAFDLYDARAGARDVWIHDLARDVRSRVTLDPMDSVFPLWSPDGQRLVYGSASQGRPLQMRVTRLDRAAADESILETNRTQVPQDWSPDGRNILFMDVSPARQPQRQLWLVPLEGERHPVPLDAATFSEYDGRYSPDGRWVAFVSEEGGRPEIVIAPVSGPGQRQQISTAGGLAPRWRRDGRELFYLSPERKLMAVSLGPGARPQIASGHELFTLGGRGELSFDVDARGERFLFTLGQEGPPIVVAVGWDSGRKD